jgi:hypothetical protein
MNVTTQDDRMVLGDRNATCHKCGAPAGVHYATNGKAEFWHSPTDCCDWARTRERTFNAASLEGDHRAREAHDAAWRASRYNPDREREAA